MHHMREAAAGTGGGYWKQVTIGKQKPGVTPGFCGAKGQIASPME